MEVLKGVNMPLYEYQCNKCGHKFEKLMAYQYRDEVYCPECGAKATVKLSSYHVRMFPIKSVKLNGNDIM